MKFDKSQLLIYAVTDRSWTGSMSLYEQTEAALKGGATMVQLREKGLRDDNVEEYLEEAKKMRALTEKYNVSLLIDDNIKLAGLCGADGVHVGQNDMDAGLARKLLGPNKILGVTAKTVEQALKAQSQGCLLYTSIIFLADIQDLIKMLIIWIFLSSHFHPCENNGSASGYNVHKTLILLETLGS